MIWHHLYRQKETVLALADEELMGREFEEGNLLLSVGDFYRGELVDEGDVAGLMEGATIINAVGERAVSAVMEACRATEQSVRRVDGVPHLQVFMHFI